MYKAEESGTVSRERLVAEYGTKFMKQFDKFKELVIASKAAK